MARPSETVAVIVCPTDTALAGEVLARFVEEGLRKERPERGRRVREWMGSRGTRPDPEGG
jgi:hypothetical protein